ncbi:MAG: hypothetical protein EZS28_021935 [Streblomastix strix]|uniref:Uncharacterized protein n=1 Tax=Streblomastix strix TaxID=222440 RepID=A0A5J4VIV8_9EUKA|nr:MAG: hypothetical protein EZS28_021935 [Streblomastix strix]
MQHEQEISDITRVIISFTGSFTYNKKSKQIEQSQSKLIPSLVDVTSSLQSLYNKVTDNSTRKSVIQIQNLLRSLIALASFKLGIHLSEEVDRQRLTLRYISRQCLYQIQRFGDEQVQSELANDEYGRVISITFSTAGGKGEELNKAISDGLLYISRFLNELQRGKTYGQQTFQPLPLLARRYEEQIEEEGANEEIEAQMSYNGLDSNINHWANKAKAATLNRFIHRRRI